MPMSPERFEREATEFRERLLAALLMPGRAIAYEAELNGVEVIILGYAHDPDEPMKSLVPLAIAIDAQLLDHIEVNATIIKPSNN